MSEEFDQACRKTGLDPAKVRDFVGGEPRAVIIDYTNHRGERRERTVIPRLGSLRVAETPDHKPAQWVFDAWDVEKEAWRTFALANLHGTRKP